MKRNNDYIMACNGVVAPSSDSTTPRDRFLQSSRLDRPWDGKPNTYFEDFLTMFQEELQNNPIRVAEELAEIPPNIAHVHGPETFLKFARFVMERCENYSDLDEQDSYERVLNRFFDPSYYHPQRVEESNAVGISTQMLRSNARSFLQDNALMDRLLVHLVHDPATARDLELLSVFSNLSFYDGGLPDPENLDVSIANNDGIPLTRVLGNLPVDVHHRILGFLESSDLLQVGRCSRATAALVRQATSLDASAFCRTTNCYHQIPEDAESELANPIFERILQIHRHFDEHSYTDLFEVAQEFPTFMGAVGAQSQRNHSSIIFHARALRTLVILQEPGTTRRMCPFSRILVFRAAAYGGFFEAKWVRAVMDLMGSIGEFVLVTHVFHHLMGGGGEDDEEA